MASVDMNMQNNVGKLYTGLNNTTSDLNKQLARAGEDRTVDYKTTSMKDKDSSQMKPTKIPTRTTNL